MAQHLDTLEDTLGAIHRGHGAQVERLTALREAFRLANEAETKAHRELSEAIAELADMVRELGQV